MSADEDVMGRVAQIMRAKNEHFVVETMTRNILLCGRTRSGKSTAIRCLVDPSHVPPPPSIFSTAGQAKLSTFTMFDERPAVRSDELAKTAYTINIIDTPGLFEVKKEKPRSNAQIQSVIADCMEREITSVHAIILFLSLEYGLGHKDIKALESCFELFDSPELRMALCISHADRHPLKWREDCKRQLLQHPALGAMIKAREATILFSGCIQPTSVELTEAQLVAAYEDVLQMRKQFLEFIFKASKRVPVDALKISQLNMANVCQLFRDCILYAQSLLVETSSEKAQQSLTKLEQAIENIQNSRVDVTKPEMSQFVSELHRLKERAKRAAPSEDVARLLSALRFLPHKGSCAHQPKGRRQAKIDELKARIAKLEAKLQQNEEAARQEREKASLPAALDPNSILVDASDDNLLGGGQNGAVYMATLQVAVKRFHSLVNPRLYGLDCDSELLDFWIQQLKKEAAISSHLRHPRVIGFYGIVYDLASQQPVWIVSELCDFTLEDLLRARPTPGASSPSVSSASLVSTSRPSRSAQEQVDLLNESERIALETAEGLAYLHERTPPVVHRDLKPSNIFFLKRQVKIGDLGEAAFQMARYVSRAGAAIYRAPEEQFKTSADIFSLGMVIAEMVSGLDPPFHEDGRSDWVNNCLETAAFQSKPRLTQVVRECTAVDPSHRPTAQAIVSFLSGFSDSLFSSSPSSSCSSA